MGTASSVRASLMTPIADIFLISWFSDSLVRCPTGMVLNGLGIPPWSSFNSLFSWFNSNQVAVPHLLESRKHIQTFGPIHIVIFPYIYFSLAIDFFHFLYLASVCFFGLDSPLAIGLYQRQCRSFGSVDTWEFLFTLTALHYFFHALYEYICCVVQFGFFQRVRFIALWLHDVWEGFGSIKNYHVHW